MKEVSVGIKDRKWKVWGENKAKAKLKEEQKNKKTRKSGNIF